ncbi:cysteine/O-acetylserine efflux protein [Roseovarius mucosus]|uniref:Cysteine/O-acetylserine efflux protein n=1 Tax=Roseovarius mucosus TaxID=215743 RepID=A0A1V0RL46_9RHOB|nr:LysE family translocator [Roseovarius mucosus]ARE82498.1 cysteine/O-acetylserine efflux protein [Roseovarius mucosus]
MTLDLLTALATFAFVTVMTPGPNNLMLMASGTNFGFSRSIPHMLGVGLGFPLMVAFVGLGVMQVFDLWPLSYTLLKIGSVAYLVYLAWKIANAAPPRDAEASGKPLTFLQSAAFQWVNPKAWSMALSAITLYATGRDMASVLWVAGVYVAVSMVSTTSWTLLGQQLRRLLKNQTRLRIFNWIMATLLIVTLIPVLWPT